MSFAIYLDDCSDHNRLIRFLTQAGHNVISPRATDTKNSDDLDHLKYAATHGYTLLTHNPSDFRRLHDDWQEQGRTHSGIFVIYRDNNVLKDMSYTDTVTAIGNLLASELPVVSAFYILNQWR